MLLTDGPTTGVSDLALEPRNVQFGGNPEWAGVQPLHLGR